MYITGNFTDIWRILKALKWEMFHNFWQMLIHQIVQLRVVKLHLWKLWKLKKMKISYISKNSIKFGNSQNLKQKCKIFLICSIKVPDSGIRHFYNSTPAGMATSLTDALFGGGLVSTADQVSSIRHSASFGVFSLALATLEQLESQWERRRFLGWNQFCSTKFVP